MVELFGWLPIDLRSIVLGYGHEVLFVLSDHELAKYDWFRLIRMHFELRYERGVSTNEQIMRVYLDNCIAASKVVTDPTNGIIRLMDGKLMGCGGNFYGELGFGDYKNRHLAEEIKNVPANVKDVICGMRHSIIILTDGTLMGCGRNQFGELGLGDNRDRNLFEEIKGIPKNIANVKCDPDHTTIRLTDGTIMRSGRNQYGHFGLGDNMNRNSFCEVKGIRKNVAEFSCQLNSSLIRFTDGTLMSCGANKFGQLGLGDNVNRNVFSEIKNIGKNVLEIKSGRRFTFIRLTDGTLMSCGRNRWGQLGLGDNIDRNVFTKINGIDKNIDEITCYCAWTTITLKNGERMVSGSYTYASQKNVFTTIPKKIEL
ncbi:MAG: chromosome condensation regulator [Hyperionvirus sp.]|uniref:Chromosome condensation regulator n=1 Tax=Hyperionvirus sp. TaxID=2487770 RepID=A0A3G5AC02_9VIRU|nr:MAG: chromosome condensation regulator [Hyperionvirus sp.]